MATRGGQLEPDKTVGAAQEAKSASAVRRLDALVLVAAATVPAVSVAEAICFDWAPLAFASCWESAWVWRAAPSSWMADWLIVVTSPRSASTA